MVSDEEAIVTTEQWPTQHGPTRLAVLTSGGDAAGMNPAIRAVVRTGLDAGLGVFFVFEGLQGLVDGGDLIRPATSRDVGGIIYRGGTVLGTARCEEFRTGTAGAGRRATWSSGASTPSSSSAATAASREPNLFARSGRSCSTSWSSSARSTVARRAAPRLALVGMVGSIDNDMFGTDMTIGADTALHRITEAIDAIQSTASSHQRSFVIEVMGRNCGYLALMSALATGANFVLIPESPPDTDEWAESMCRASRPAGRSADAPTS